MNITLRNKPAVRIEGAKALIGGAFETVAINIDSGTGSIGDIDSGVEAGRTFHADDLLALPGIVDIHGDAFERQMMPRPRVHFSLDIAMAESDRQAVANGITTVFHGVTWSWEPGLRAAENARAIVDCLERIRPSLAADTRVHLRHETFNLDAEQEIMEWLRAGRIDALAFNDHMSIAVEATSRGNKLVPMVERSGVSKEEFLAIVERTAQRAQEVPDSIARLAEVAVTNGVPLLSHDDNSPEQRGWFRGLGCRLAEFPTTAETAKAAAEAGDDIVMGAPNVVRGGSHTGWIGAAEMVGLGQCSVLASDYYYPAPLLAAFRLAADDVRPLEQAWDLVSATPASAMGLRDRGRIASGNRADLILVDAADPRQPRIVATVVSGRFVYVADMARLGA